MFELDTTIPSDIKEKMVNTLSMFNNQCSAPITTQGEFDYAGEQLVQMKGEVKVVVEAKENITKPLNTEKTRVIDEFRTFLDKCDDIERIFKGSMVAFQVEEDRKRREEEANEAEKARKKQNRLMGRAENAAEKGHDEKAAELESQALSTSAALVDQAPKTKGVSNRETWSGEITNKKEFVIAAATNPALLNCLDINQSNLNKLAGMMKEEFDFPGAKATSKKSFAIRSA